MENGIDRYLKMLLEQNKTEVLGIALKFKIFNYLEKQEMSLALLVKELNTDFKNTKTLLEAMEMIDLIYKEDGFFKNSEISKSYFIKGSSTYCGDVFLHRQEMLNYGRKAMVKLVQDGGQDIANSKSPKKWATASRRFLKQEQKNLISKEAVSLVQSLKEFPKMTKILDLGCASGILGLEIVKSHPSAKGVLFDFPDVTEVVLEHIQEYELQERVSILCGDIQEDDIGSGYDLIWCSNIFYFLENKEEVIEKIYKALNPNGIFISVHVEVGEEKSSYEDSFFYFLGLNFQGRDILKPMDLTNILEEKGFKSINAYTTSKLPMTPTQIQIAKK